MTASFTISESASFTVTHARHMASKVATDLKRLQRFYGYPSDSRIADFEIELIELLKAGYMKTITYGFRRNGNWIEPALRYTARDLSGMAANDDDPGRVKPGLNIVGAEFYSFLTYTAAWEALSETAKHAFKSRMPFYRGGAPEPGVTGYFTSDKTYSAGGQALDRTSVRSS
jgi:hypothetical protein